MFSSVEAVCGQYKPIAYVVTVFLGVLITVLANWRRYGGRFRPEYVFVGAELSTGAIIAGIALLVEFGYAIWCTDGTFSHATHWIVTYPARAAESVLIVIYVRVFQYCRNQERRSLRTGQTYRRGLRNTFAGSLAFTMSLLAF